MCKCEYSTEFIKRMLADDCDVHYMELSCPDCGWDITDDQYTCTSCWQQGGNGKINVEQLILDLLEEREK